MMKSFWNKIIVILFCNIFCCLCISAKNEELNPENNSISYGLSSLKDLDGMFLKGTTIIFQEPNLVFYNTNK